VRRVTGHRRPRRGRKLVFGELVPKRFGLSNPEGIAMAIARPMNWLSKLAGPLVTFLSVSTEGLLRLLGFKPEKEAAVSEEEVRAMMQEGLRAGAFNPRRFPPA
jgi:putative hemolysin